MAPNAKTHLRTLRSYVAHQYEGGDAGTGPWPGDPDGGQMRIIVALDAILRDCTDRDAVLVADIERTVALSFAGAQEEVS